MRTLGLVMKMGKITAVQADSPADEADLRAGDFITAIDGQSPGDPMRLPEGCAAAPARRSRSPFRATGQPGQDREAGKTNHAARAAVERGIGDWLPRRCRFPPWASPTTC